jgi:penicillin-insensitive murein endopeptidase
LRYPVLFIAVLLGACSGSRETATPPLAATRAVAPIHVEPLPVAAEAPPVRILSPSITTAELSAKLETAPESLASMSIGSPNHGALFNAIQLPESPRWHVVEPENAWGTDESVASIVQAIGAVHEQFEKTPLLYIGHLSSRRGGYLRPHRSHQSGRDADIGFYYSGGPGWYLRGTAKTLDLGRTWALVKAFASDPNVENIFVDRSVQRLLRDYALKSGETPEFLDGIFETRNHRDRVVRHEWGHLTHLHVRFRSPIAEGAGVRAGPELAAMDARHGSSPVAHSRDRADSTTGRSRSSRARSRSRS